MKKLVLIITIILFSVIVSGCQNINQELEREKQVKDFQGVLTNVFDNLSPTYEDLEWEDFLADGSFYGNASIANTQKESLELLHYANGVAIRIIIEFENETRQKMEIYFIDIYYINVTDKIYINLELSGDNFTINYNKDLLAKNLVLFNQNELLYLFDYLGYEEVNYYTITKPQYLTFRTKLWATI